MEREYDLSLKRCVVCGHKLTEENMKEELTNEMRDWLRQADQTRFCVTVLDFKHEFNLSTDMTIEYINDYLLEIL